jgi:hypothetical protein
MALQVVMVLQLPQPIIKPLEVAKPKVLVSYSDSDSAEFAFVLIS